MVALNQIRIGSKVIVRGDFGGGRPVIGTVEEVEKDIKNGYPGISYSTGEKFGGSWAYLSQVDSVIEF